MYVLRARHTTGIRVVCGGCVNEVRVSVGPWRISAYVNKGTARTVRSARGDFWWPVVRAGATTS